MASSSLFRDRVLLVALIMAAVGAFLLYRYIAQIEHQASGGERVAVLVAKQNIDVGANVEEGMLGVVQLPEACVDRHIRADELATVAGAPLGTALKAGEALLRTDLTEAEYMRSLEGVIRKGRRAVPIEAQNLGDFAGSIQPGSRVDILLTTSGRDGQAMTRMLLQNMLVIAVGGFTGGQGGMNRAGAGSVMLSASLREAQILTLAPTQGSLSILMRNPEEVEELENVPEVEAEDLAPGRTSVLESLDEGDNE